MVIVTMESMDNENKMKRYGCKSIEDEKSMDG